MASRMQAIGRDPDSRFDHGNSTRRIRLALPSKLERQEILTLLRSAPAKRDFRSALRLAASELKKVTPEHLYNAVQSLLTPGADHSIASCLR
jgi:5-methylcytosine-specific restriction protein A